MSELKLTEQEWLDKMKADGFECYRTEDLKPKLEAYYRIFGDSETGDFISRLKEEKAQLDIRREKLEAFQHSPKFQEIDPVQMSLLNIQGHLMLAYSQTLTERIVRLEPVEA